jgi:flagella basal body P-ring formation protein FlgA
MLSRTAITAAVSLATLVCGGSADLCASAERFSVSPEAVVQTIRARGLQIEQQQVSFLASITATRAEPQLRIVGARKLDTSRTAVQMSCESNAVCLPFYVILHGDSAEQYRVLTQPIPGAKGKRLPRPVEKPCIRTGDRASLVMENQDMRITVQVIALQNGRTGDTIRVTDTERKKLYRAEVSGPGLLKSAL